MAAEHNEVPLNAIRVFVTIAREESVTRAASTLGATQSSVSRYLAVLQDYFGTDLVQRRGRRSELTEFGRLFANAVAEPLDTVCFTAKRMRRRIRTDANRIVVHTSLSTFAYSFLIPNLQAFSAEMGGVVVDVISSLSPPRSSDNFDILLTRIFVSLNPPTIGPIYNETLVCVGSPNHVMGKTLSTVHSMPILNITSRPDILPTWLRAMNLSAKDIKSGARYDHNYLALPAVMTGKCLLVAPEIIVSDLVRTGALHVIPGSRTSSGMQYRAYAVDRSDNPEIARAFCRWVARLCKKAAIPDAA
ncbi:LysR family transcriptional regulator [Bradyrhizobium sp. 193]|uniref:LysR family transcriptional regulator n=1 Tax=Bradyrhizobium sp. 193 TaxID=2782661 RepID=UPI001FFA3D1B|nr:LysR family transcriptional regulator [Bradyrhizobium sp. 193]MCK1486725.1 LysR family transcriptional regulator [Bradyrhizobium sp. 193]